MLSLVVSTHSDYDTIAGCVLIPPLTVIAWYCYRLLNCIVCVLCVCVLCVCVLCVCVLCVCVVCVCGVCVWCVCVWCVCVCLFSDMFSSASITFSQDT